jgi:hypothetical protein
MATFVSNYVNINLKYKIVVMYFILIYFISVECSIILLTRIFSKMCVSNTSKDDAC